MINFALFNEETKNNMLKKYENDDESFKEDKEIILSFWHNL